MKSTDPKEQERTRPPGTHSSEVSECRAPFRHGAIKLLRPDRDDAAAAFDREGERLKNRVAGAHVPKFFGLGAIASGRAWQRRKELRARYAPLIETRARSERARLERAAENGLQGHDS